MLFVLVSTFAFSQGAEKQKLYIEGRVFSGVNKEPLGNVRVYIKPRSIYTVLTDKSGYFKLPFNGLGEDLTTGQYPLVVNGLPYNVLDTLITLHTEPIQELKIVLTANCPKDRESAEADILAGQPKLFISSGASHIIFDGSLKFERKYKARYVDIGEHPVVDACLKGYSERIFEHLDSKYGKRWRKSVRSDVLYLKRTD